MNLMILYGKSQDRNVRELIRESKRLGHKVVVSRVADISAQVDGREMSFGIAEENSKSQNYASFAVWDRVSMRPLQRGWRYFFKWSYAVRV